MGFRFARSSDNISLIKQQYHSSITNISHPISQKHSFLENQHAQGQTYIPIIGFPDPNYGIKIVNQIIKSLHLLISLCHLFFALLRGLSSSHSLVQTQCYIYQIEYNLVQILKIRLISTFRVKYPCQIKKGYGVFQDLHQRDVILKF